MALPNALSTDTVGGINKVDYQPDTDPTTDRTADQINNAFAAVVGMSATSLKAVLRFDATATSGVVTLAAFASVWGAGITQRPTVSRTSAGRYQVTFPAQILSLLNTQEDLNVVAGFVSISASSNSDGRAAVRVMAPNVVEIQLMDVTGFDDLLGEQVTLAVI